MTNDYSKIHPQLHEVVKKSPKFNFSGGSIWFIKLIMSLMPAPKTPQDILIENIHIRRQDDQTRIRLRVYKPKNISTSTPALLWLHGGGYIIGNPEMDDHGCVEFARELGLIVISVDYRLAPKHPFPAGLNDAHEALKWIVLHAQELGVNPNLIAIGGESAGGGLAAALAQLAHDRQEIKPAFQLLIYPMLDDKTVLRTDIDDSNNVTWTQKSNRFGWESYLGGECGAEDVPAYSVPARRKDLTGLPPAWVGVGTLDIFHDEDMAYAQKLNTCGVECETIIVPGAFHGFDRFDLQLPIVQEFHKSKIAALRNYLFE